MAFRLNLENLPAAYEYLRACDPFRGWKLPEADEVGFQITRHADRFGHHGGKIIAISERCVGSSWKLLEIMGHEMIHLYQFNKGTETSNTEHNAEFKRLARRVCSVHGWDPKAFV